MVRARAMALCRGMGTQVTSLDFMFSLPYCPGILYMHDCMCSALHTPSGLYMLNRNRRRAENEKAQGSYLGVPSTKSFFSMGKQFWCLAVVTHQRWGSWGFQVGYKEIWSAMNGSSVYHRQLEKWFS